MNIAYIHSSYRSCRCLSRMRASPDGWGFLGWQRLVSWKEVCKFHRVKKLKLLISQTISNSCHGKSRHGIWM